MTELDTLLREAGSGLSLDLPASRVVERGRRIRRRRRIRVAAAVVVVTMVTVGGAAAFSLTDSSRQSSTAARPDGILALGPRDLLGSDHACRRLIRQTGTPLGKDVRTSTLRLVAATKVIEGPFLLYADGHRQFDCAIEGYVGGASGSVGGGVTRVGEPEPGRALVNTLNLVTNLSGEGPGSLVDAGRMSPQVARITAEFRGRRVPVATGGGWYFLWTSAHTSPVSPHAAPVTLTAYYAHGTVLDRITVADGRELSPVG